MLLHKDVPVREFATPAAFGAWLAEHHATEPAFWLRIYKKATGIPTLDWTQAVQEALCWGWIDSVKNSYDEISFVQRFGPRRPKSVWSQINCGHVERLTAEGRMQPAGLAHVAAAKASGAWDRAYAASRDLTVPDDLQALLDAEPAAKAFFEGLNKTNRYTFVTRIALVKTDATRQKKLAWAMDLLRRGEKVH